ncbi:MAG: CoA transferase, partial [Candidatus Methylomirabilis sp.]|nr:CoA transferase [Deltaproteobacteria bacterium]
MSRLPLEGVRVLDLTRLLPGPFATMILADLGAEVVKVEEPGRGDYTRWNRIRVGDTSAYFLAINRGKKSVALDLKKPAAREALLRLARSADVLVETFRPGVMDRLGAGYEAARAANPRLVYCSLTGYGQTGPYRDLPGHDNNYLGYAGLLSVTGERGGPPRLLGTQVADLGGAQMTAIAILAALRHRDRTGEGQYLDAALMDAGLYW